MRVFKVNAEGTLLVSGAIDDWAAVREHKVSTIVDLEGGVDAGLPEQDNDLLYVYFPIADDYLPDLERLHAVARMVAELVQRGQVVLVHCLLGLNRSNLMIATALTYLGLSGAEAVKHLRVLQPGALLNETFAEYAMRLPARSL
jgi:atypical dual specificity phosphatase